MSEPEFYIEYYGILSRDMESIARKLETILGLKFVERDSTELGDCFSSLSAVRLETGSKKGWIDLTLCWNDTKREYGWVFPSFKEFPLILKALHPGPPDRIRKPLAEMDDPKPELLTQTFFFDEDSHKTLFSRFDEVGTQES